MNYDDAFINSFKFSFLKMKIQRSKNIRKLTNDTVCIYNLEEIKS